MKSILIVMLFLSVTSAFAGKINEIECSGVPNWVQFNLRLNYNTGTFHGEGTENYANLQFDCKKSANLKTIVCEAPSPYGNEVVTAIITMDQNNVITAKYHGIYSKHRDLKLGCIARM